jgi:hypothetical protein
VQLVTPLLFLYCFPQPGMDTLQVTTAYPTASPTASPTVGTFANCWDAHQAGEPTGSTRISAPGWGYERNVYCDQDNDGGGWALVATILHSSTDHSNLGCVNEGCSNGIILPIDRVAKYEDAMIRELSGNVPAGMNDIKFQCGSFPDNFFNGCRFDAHDGLDENGHPHGGSDSSCIVAYRDADSTSNIINNVKCNAGSQGVGSHCSQNNAAAYCSHCPGGEAPYSGSCHRGGGGLRCGCWVDGTHYSQNGGNSNGYGDDGKLWVR